MADSKRSPRPKAPRPSGSGGGKAGGGKSGGKAPRQRSGGKGGTSGGHSGGWSTSKPGGGGKPGGFRRDDKRDARRDDSPAPRKPRERVDDFDFDVSDAPRPAFPKPARPAGPAGQPGGKAGGKDRPERRPAPRKPEGPRQARGDQDLLDHHNAERRPARAPQGEGAEGEALPEGKSVTAGRNPVRELLESAPRRVDGVFVRKGQREAKVQEIVALADANRIKVQFVDDAVLRRLYSGTHQGVVAVTAAVEYAELDALIATVADAPLPVLLALDQVQDPGNLGAMARTAWALGAAGIIVPRHGGAYIGAGAMRASAGALHHLPVARVTNMSQALDACAKAGLNILCADGEGEDVNTAAIRLPAVLVLGGEEKGVRHGVGKHCDQRLAIPLKRAFDSLNVAQAAAIILARLGQL